jgi:hypothetical protein
MVFDMNKTNNLKIIVIVLIILYVLKISSIGIYMYYEKSLADDIEDKNDTIITEFNSLIDINFMKKAFDENNNFDINFIKIIPTNNKEYFTHILIITLGKIDEKNYDKIREYVNSNEIKDLKEIIKLYIHYSGDIAYELFKLDEKTLNTIQGNLQKFENNFYILLNFIKKQNYPINIVVDTLLLFAIILYFTGYLFYYKLYNFILMIFIILIIIGCFFYKDYTLFIIGVLIVIYGLYFYMLYRYINK